MKSSFGKTAEDGTWSSSSGIGTKPTILSLYVMDRCFGLVDKLFRFPTDPKYDRLRLQNSQAGPFKNAARVKRIPVKATSSTSPNMPRPR